MAFVGLALTREARAQSNAALAEQLFLDGQKLMEASDYAAACPKFADSQRLDPALGTLMHLASCHEKAGRTATAWSEFSDAAALAHKANQTDRENFARSHASALEGQLQKLIIELPRAPEGTTIRLDGAVLPTGVLGTEIPLDPGEHSLEVSAPGKKTWRQAKLNLGPSAMVSRVQVALEDEAAPGSPAPSSDVPAPGGGASPHPADSLPVTPPMADSHATSSNSTKRILGYALAGAGVVAIVVGVGEEVTSIGRNNDVGKYPAGSTQRQSVSDEGSQAQTYALVIGGAGVVAAGIGMFLALTSHASASPAPATGRAFVTPWVAAHGGGAGVGVAF
jgi:hypothetical protein